MIFEAKFGISPEQTQLLAHNTQVYREQYRLKHRAIWKIHRETDDTLIKMATEISTSDP